MEKILLKDGTKIEVVSVSENQIKIDCKVTDASRYFEKFTQINLSKFSLINENDETMATIVNKACASFFFEDGIATYNLRTVDAIEQRIIELEDAISDIGDIVYSYMASIEEE